jgi:hypothetical protein
MGWHAINWTWLLPEVGAEQDLDKAYSPLQIDQGLGPKLLKLLGVPSSSLNLALRTPVETIWTKTVKVSMPLWIAFSDPWRNHYSFPPLASMG